MNPYAEPAERGERDPWYSRGACYGVKGAEWFPTARTPLAAIENARAICRTCPVRDQCKPAGDAEKWGIWGGKNRAPSIERTIRDRASMNAAKAAKARRDKERAAKKSLEQLLNEQRAVLDAIVSARHG